MKKPITLKRLQDAQEMKKNQRLNSYEILKKELLPTSLFEKWAVSIGFGFDELETALYKIDIGYPIACRLRISIGIVRLLIIAILINQAAAFDSLSKMAAVAAMIALCFMIFGLISVLINATYPDEQKRIAESIGKDIYLCIEVFGWKNVDADLVTSNNAVIERFQRQVRNGLDDQAKLCLESEDHDLLDIYFRSIEASGRFGFEPAQTEATMLLLQKIAAAQEEEESEFEPQDSEAIMPLTETNTVTA